MKDTISRRISIGPGLFLICCVCMPGLQAQPKEANYDEAKVPSYTLPDPLMMANGQPVADAKTWRKKRRPEILHLFETHVYGRSPDRPPVLVAEVTSVDTQALVGKATRKEVSVYFTSRRENPKMDILIYLPHDARGPVPIFLGLNFEGNHSIHTDPGITLSKQWMRPNKETGIVNNRATEESRGKSASRWQVEKILARGYGLATIYYGDIEPDFPEGWRQGLRSVLQVEDGPEQKTFVDWLKKRSKEKTDGNDAKAEAALPGSDHWGAIGAWAWGLSRAMDYFETDDDIDAKRVVLMGHSRLGKTALWAGAQDERFAIVISNNSGEGGAALTRRRFGETIERINTSFPHWFCANFKKYNNNEDASPVDQHMLIALIAPRPVYVASAAEDLWADPRGEFLAAKNAEPVYRLLGKEGLGADEMPGVDQPVGGTIGYHIRTGKHDVTAYDWEQYLNFADKHFSKEKP